MKELYLLVSYIALLLSATCYATPALIASGPVLLVFSRFTLLALLALLTITGIAWYRNRRLK